MKNLDPLYVRLQEISSPVRYQHGQRGFAGRFLQGPQKTEAE